MLENIEPPDNYLRIYISQISFDYVGDRLILTDEALEKTLDRLSTSQKELLRHVTEKLEKLSQQITGKTTQEMGETSTLNPQPSGNRHFYAPPLKNTSSLSSFIPKMVELDFPRYDGMDDLTTWMCRANKYF
ncbi:hypothetical protein ACOSQ2_031662 [Xanthoceras sorbifolium]